MDYYKLKVLNNKKKFVFAGILVLMILLSYYFFVYEKKDDVKIETEKIFEDEKKEVNQDNIIVDIKGHVKNPGVYTFNENDNARINDLIAKAGGLLKDADTSTINLSKKLEDEMIIIIYSKSEITNYVKTQDEAKRKLEICENKLKNDACINNVSNSGKININEASINELESLNGIGKSKAEAIVEYRNKTKFKSIDEIMNVDGIGENLFASIKDNITV